MLFRIDFIVIAIENIEFELGYEYGFKGDILILYSVIKIIPIHKLLL